MSLTKTPSITSFSATGVSITYTYVVRNIGSVTIPATATIAVSDNKIATVDVPGCSRWRARTERDVDLLGVHDHDAGRPQCRHDHQHGDSDGRHGDVGAGHGDRDGHANCRP